MSVNNKIMYKYCNRCGERLPDNSRFCPSCGQALPWAGDVSPRGYDAGDDIQWMEPDMSATFSAMSRVLEKKAVKEESVWQEPVLEDFQVIYKKGKYILPVDSFTVKYRLSNCTEAVVRITDGKSEDEIPLSLAHQGMIINIERYSYVADLQISLKYGNPRYENMVSSVHVLPFASGYKIIYRYFLLTMGVICSVVGLGLLNVLLNDAEKNSWFRVILFIMVPILGVYCFMRMRIYDKNFREKNSTE